MFRGLDLLQQLARAPDRSRLDAVGHADGGDTRRAVEVTRQRRVCCRSAEPLPLQTIGFRGQEGADHEIRFGVAGSCECVGIMPACSEESEPGVSLASLDNIRTVGSTHNGAEPDRNTALTKECEFESPETIAASEKNLEDRERIVVMDR